MRESAVSAKRGWVSFGAKPAHSETPARAAAERRTPGRGEVGKDAELPITRLLSAGTVVPLDSYKDLRTKPPTGNPKIAFQCCVVARPIIVNS